MKTKSIVRALDKNLIKWSGSPQTRHWFYCACSRTHGVQWQDVKGNAKGLVVWEINLPKFQVAKSFEPKTIKALIRLIAE